MTKVNYKFNGIAQIEDIDFDVETTKETKIGTMLLGAKIVGEKCRVLRFYATLPGTDAEYIDGGFCEKDGTIIMLFNNGIGGYTTGDENKRVCVAMPDAFMPIYRKYRGGDNDCGFLIQTIVDDRSRAYLSKIAERFESYRVCDDGDDNGAEDGEKTMILGQDIDSYSVAYYRGGDEKLARQIIAAVDLLRHRNATYKCWECGHTTHWLDTVTDGDKSFAAKLNCLEEKYCGC